MSALVSVTICEGSILRRLVGASAYQHLCQQGADKARPSGERRHHRPTASRIATGTQVLQALADAEQPLTRFDLEDVLAGVSLDAIIWHCRQIEAAGHARVIVERHGRKRYEITDAGRHALAALDPHATKGGRMTQVEAWLRAHPGATSGEIAAALTLNRHGLDGVLARLLDAGRIEVLPGGRPRRYRVTEEASQ